MQGARYKKDYRDADKYRFKRFFKNICVNLCLCDARRQVCNLRFHHVLVLVSFFLVGCNGGALWLWGDKYVARINDDTITEYDFKKRLEGFHTVKDIGDKMQIDIANVDYHKILNDMIDDKLIVNEALKIGLDKTPEFTGDYKLSKLNLSLYMLKKEEIIDKIKVTEDEIRKRYVYFNESVRLRHFFTKSQEKGEKILEEIKNGADFAKLVNEESDDIEEIKKRGGDIGFKRRVDLPGEASDIVFAMKEGEISGLIKIKDGFHILKIEEKKAPSGEISEKDRRRIERLLFNEKENEKNKEYLAGLRMRAKVEIDDTLLKSIKKEDDFDGGKTTVGIVDGETIKRDEVLVRLKARQDFNDEDGLERHRNDIIESLIRQKLLDMEVGRRNYEGNRDFSYTLSQTREAILISLFKAKIIAAAIKVDDSEIKNFYEANKEKFKDFESSRNIIFESIFKEKYEQLLADYLKKLRDNSKIRINETAINSFIKPKKNMAGENGKESIH